jgi:hypothetical protein
MVGRRQALGQGIVALGMGISEALLEVFRGKFDDLVAPGFGGACWCRTHERKQHRDCKIS